MTKRICFLVATVLALSLILQSAETAQAIDSKAWSIVATYNIPEGAAGLAWDGTYLYCGIYGNGQIYRINPTDGSYALQCTGPQATSYGLTFDGTNFWTTDHPSNPAKAIQFNMSGTLITQFNLPAQYISGIAYDNGNYWVARYYPDPSVIYKVNSSGAVLKQFTAPNNQPWDLCMQGADLWMADYWGDMLYKIDTSGTVLDSHASQNIDPAGIVWDGSYLWYCDNGASGSYDRLYKVDLSGSGTPAINLPVNSHNYGTVTVGTPVTWNATVQNTGTADLVISGATISGSTAVTCPTVFPVTITPASETQLPFVYAPMSAGPLNAVASIASNDPIHPTIDLTLTGNAVNPGPNIYLPEDHHDYDTTVRAGAFTRWTMSIVNDGDANLIVSNITSSDMHFTIDDRVTYPIYIYPLDTARIGIWFRPLATQAYTSTLSIANNDPDANPFSVALQGSGLLAESPIGDTLWQDLITGGSDNSPKAIASIPDINGDGVPDVIVCSEDYTVRALNGNADAHGDVLWEHFIYSGSIYNQNSLTITQDVNGDGYSDVVVGAAWGARLIRTISGRTGTEIWTHDTHEYGSGGWVYQVDCSYDYNNDGVIDVLAATGNDAYYTGPIRVYCLNGTTGVPIWQCPLGGPVFSVIGVEDFNSDGKPDVVAGASTVDETSGKVFGINGANGGVLWNLTVSGTSVWALRQIDDINSDGTKDVAVGDFSATAGSVYGVNARTGGVVWTRPGFGMILRLEKFEDLNNDGHPDLVPAHAGTSAIAVDGQTGTVIWSHALADKSWSVVRGNDVSGDGTNDVFVGTLYTGNFCYFLNGKDGAELKAIPFSSPIDALGAIPDVAGDGSMEMIAGGRSGELFCFSGGINSVSNHLPNMPGSPVPADGVPGVSVATSLSWSGGDPDPGDVVKYDIYLGTVNPPPVAGSTESATTFDPPGNLQANIQYYWQILAKDSYGGSRTGPLWSFTTGNAICGDVDANGLVNISDVVYLIAYVFSGGPAPNPTSSGDVDCTGIVNVSDVVYLIAYIFSGGPAPCVGCK